MRTKQVALSLGSLALMLSVATAGRAETMMCTPVATLPATITAPGIYCLTSDFSISLAGWAGAITINASDVVLDLNGHTITNVPRGLPGTATGGAYGVVAYYRKNITIKHGTIRGFFCGIFLSDNPPFATSKGHLIEDIRAEQSTLIGLAVYGSGIVVRHNQVVATGGSAQVNADGIDANGPSMRIIDNDVIDVSSTGAPIGIRYFGDNGVVLGNRITDVENGICLSQSSPTTKYRDNLTTGVAGAPYWGGTDAGNNN